MDYREYLQKQLGKIRDIEERMEARELLLERFVDLVTEVKLYLLHQQKVNSSYGYTAPVLSNKR